MIRIRIRQPQWQILLNQLPQHQHKKSGDQQPQDQRKISGNQQRQDQRKLNGNQQRQDQPENLRVREKRIFNFNIQSCACKCTPHTPYANRWTDCP
jgi:hypothetical protein